MSRTSSSFFASKSDAVAATARSITSLTETLVMFQVNLPASIFARSSTSSMSLVRRSPSLTTMPRFSMTWRLACCTLRSSSGIIGNNRSSRRRRMIFAKPRTEVSGVRSSWLTVERNELLAASACSAAARAWPASSNSLALWNATPTAVAIVESRR